MTEPREPRFVDFKIPLWGVLVFCVSMLGQTATLIVWGSKLDQRVAVLEEKVADTGKLGETVARIDERTKALVETVNRMADERP